MRGFGWLAFLCGFFAAACGWFSPVFADVLKTLYAFPGGGDGLDPYGGLTSVGSLMYGTTSFGGAYSRGALFSVDPASGAENVVYSFAGGADVGGMQVGVLAVGNVLYGVGNYGGKYGYGGVYSYDITTGKETVLFSFTPAMGGGSGSSLTLYDKALYGTTFGGGTGAGYGTVFKLDLTTNTETTLYSFTGGADGAIPQYGVAYADGMLYGTTTVGGADSAGTLFAVDATTGAETTLFTFDGGTHGGGAYGGVIDVGGMLYGTATYGGTHGSGVIFAYDLATKTERTVYNFTGGADGSEPQSALIDVGGVLYGTTYGIYGTTTGTSKYGSVFAVNAKTGAETTLYAFPADGSNGGHSLTPLLYANGAVYGTSFGLESDSSQCGTVFKVVVATKAETTLHAFVGASPFGTGKSGVVAYQGDLYGTTGGGGAHFAGTVYRLDPGRKTESTIYTFTGGADGGAPKGGLVVDGSTLYGVTQIGGANQSGTIFEVNPTTGTETVVYSFPAGLGFPNGPLALFNDVLYGTTQAGGSAGAGSVFAYHPGTKVFTTIYSFKGSPDDGSVPVAGVIASGGFLYGTTYSGGSAFFGTVFKIDIATAKETVLYDFPLGADGGYPASPVVDVDGVLYGTTEYGGSSSADCFGGFGCGVVYSLDTASGAFTVLHSFAYGADGAQPVGGLLVDGGALIGTTSFAGAKGAGTIFSYVPGSSSFSTLHGFSGGADGGGPTDALINLGDGMYYGTTNSGDTAGQGTVFLFAP